MKKTVCILLLIVLLSISVISCAAPKTSSATMGDIVSGADSFLTKAEVEEIDKGDLQNLSGTLYNVLLVLAIIIAIVVGLILAIKLISGGAVEKADIKQAFVPYVVGLVVVFGAFGIWKIVVTLLNSVT